MSNLTWTDNRQHIYCTSNEDNTIWKWENGATCTVNFKNGPDATWSITPTYTFMRETNAFNETPERTMWCVDFGSVITNQYNHTVEMVWTPMKAAYTYDQVWSPSVRAATCLQTGRFLFYSLDHAKKFCETTAGFSIEVCTSEVI